MSTSLLRVVERAQQDAEQGPEAIQSNGLRRLRDPLMFFIKFII